MSIYTANLSAVVQIRMHSDTTGADDAPGSQWWKSLAAFISHQRAEAYAADERKRNPRKEYRIIDL